MLVKAAVSQAILREVELNVRVVSQKEFKDSSRVINKEMYDKYKVSFLDITVLCLYSRYFTNF